MQTPLAVDPIATPHPVPLPMRPMCPSGMGHAEGEANMKDRFIMIFMLVISALTSAVALWLVWAFVGYLMTML
jgi:hypothetical protein